METVWDQSSKLANLFSENDTAKTGNSSLTYTPPRQPSVGKSADKQSASSGVLSLLCAAAVQAFKYEGKKPSNQGKLGIAVLGNHDTTDYRLILYREKQQQVALAAINAQFVIKVQGDNFLSFVDEKRFNWSVKFDSEAGFINFVKQIVIAKAESHGAGLVDLENTISQDLILGDGESEALKIGSTAVIKYTAWVLRDHILKKVLDTTDIDEPQKLKLGRGKQVKGLEEGLVGCRNNSRRFLVVPPSQGYGSKGLGTTVPPNAILVFDVSVGPISKSKSTTKDSTPRLSTPVSVVAEDADRKDGRSYSHGSVDEPARSRAPSAPLEWPPQQQPATTSATALAAVGSGESDKARLLSRMAKIGAQMLPMAGPVPAQPSSDSEAEEERPLVTQQVPVAVPLPQPSSRGGSPKPMVKPRTFSQHSVGDAVAHPTLIPPTLQPTVSSYAPAAPTMPAAPHMALYQAQSQLASTLAAYPYQQQGLLLPPGAHSYPAAPVPTATSVAVDMQLPLLLSETRSQNTEVRLDISKLSDKVDTILGKLDAVKSQLPSAPQLGSHMDSDVLLYNIQRIVQENQKLKNDNGVKDHKIQGLNEKICDLLQKNQRLMEVSNSMFEQRSDALHSSAANSQARLLALETEKMEATERLARALSELATLRAQLTERQQKEGQAQKELEELRSTSEGKVGTLKSLEDSLKEKEEQRKHLEEEVQRQKKELYNATYIHEKKVAAVNEALSLCQKECDNLRSQINQLRDLHQEEVNSLASRISELVAKGESKLKKVMNVLFKLLQLEFASQETYSKDEALEIILTTIREYTEEFLRQERQAPSASSNSTSKSFSASTASNSSTGSPPASGPINATASAPAIKAAAPQLQKNLGETEKLENKNHGSSETPLATEEPLSTPLTMGLAGDERSAHSSDAMEVAPEDSGLKLSVAKVPETAEEPVHLDVPVAQACEEKDATDGTKEKGSGDAGLSSSAGGKTGPMPPADSKSVQPQDWTSGDNVKTRDTMKNWCLLLQESFLASLQQASHVYGQNIPPVWMTLLSLAALIVSLLAVRYGLYY
ncbi:FK506-binding protein 15 isoform X3 [Rhipicephalus microplus]|uniref:FK506-binding protein 15 isoform X3 n=1 Tax=Rhipicephalus microplus TaxID=6941 RepID=UPI003F6BDF90